MNACVKITDKGQITIPREIRNILKTKLVSFQQIREAAWEKAIREKTVS
jgi:bifunctional DNA-binding transcriptional regulator/antitoxin component of YhaV-PrlF toxin-antitoxin module